MGPDRIIAIAGRLTPGIEADVPTIMPDPIVVAGASRPGDGSG
jgi:hypothetical protein